jgi:diguanylate cyclase (GGDEF)-like protein/PAS domain S-box-containing protein
MFGFNDDDIDTNRQDWTNRVYPDDLPSMTEAINNYLLGKTTKYIHEHRVICKDKSIKWVLSRGMIVKRDKNGKPMRMVGTHTDITERKLLESKLQNLAHYDSLCNLPNRTLFNDRLKLALSFAKREKKKLAVMFIDLDHFKEINDVYGHQAGDKVLKQVAQRLVASVRESDTVARLGGDEFVVLLPIIDNEAHATLVASKIVEAVDQPIRIAQSEMRVSSSIGIAIYPQHGKDEKLLVINADMAMYQAKENGKNQSKMFDKAILK